MSNEWRDSKRRVEVLGDEMAYVERGSGRPIVLLHGNPTSSYLWRDVIPALEPHGRCIAPDLIGMGDSAKLPADDLHRYTFARHAEFLDGFLAAVDADDDVVLVVHDWGSALGFDWTRRHPDRVRGIAYTEAMVRPFADWDEWPDGARAIFQAMRSPAGEQLVLEENVFVEQILPSSILRDLSAAEMTEYRRPFTTPGDDRLPTLMWPRQIPIEGEPDATREVIDAYGAWLAASDDLPKLLLVADPGAILAGAALEFARTWPNQEEATVPGSHFVQEDSGAEIGRLIADWLARQN